MDQSSALYLLAINYPNLPGASGWLALASKRIAEEEIQIIDSDGILVENSPYYHFYVLEKFLEIQKYLKQNHLKIEGLEDEKIDQMISYATYILQPDLSIPTIGASIGRQINLFGMYREISESHPELLYVLSKGEYGTVPASLNVQYKTSGETIMRSGWGKGKGFTNQTQLIFDAGEYRTNHSDLDALSFNLFGAGIPLMPDSGLYTYEDGPYRSYFHGTRAHNTVVVDGKDQNIGWGKDVFAGALTQGDGYVYQSGEENLNDGVSHKRAVVMIEDSIVLVLDDLKSSSEHTYEQMFHIFPSAQIKSNGLTLVAQSKEPNQTLTIKQLTNAGIELHTSINQTEPPEGVCSVQYKILVPCYSVSYSQKAKNASYITAITISKKDINVTLNGNVITVTTSNKMYSIKVDETQNIDRNIQVDKKFNTSSIYSVLRADMDLNIFQNRQQAPNPVGVFGGGKVSVNTYEKSLELMTSPNGSHTETSTATQLDLSKQNIYFKFKVDHTQDLQGFDLYLSNNNWGNYAKTNIKSFISVSSTNQDSEWIEFGVAKGDLRKEVLGGWVFKDPNFDWSRIDNIKLAATSKVDKSVLIDVKDISLAPDEANSRAIIIFDDGWGSVMDALKIMNKYDFKGNVGIITGSVGTKRYLTLDDLNILQNEYGWDIANHTNLHKDAVKEYINTGNVKGFETDVTDALGI